MNASPKALSEVLLMVEGLDEVLVIAKLLNRPLSKSEQKEGAFLFEDPETKTRVSVESFDGRGELRDYLTALKDRSMFNGVRRFGLLIDAEENIDATHDVIRGAWTLAKTSLPVSQFVLPDNAAHGSLEHLILSTIADDMAMPCVEEFAKCIETQVQSLAPATEAQRGKLKVTAWCAAQKRPYSSVGFAFTQSNLFNLDHPALAPLKQFLTDLRAPLAAQSVSPTS